VKAIDKRNLYLLDYAIYPNRYLKRKTAVSPNPNPPIKPQNDRCKNQAIIYE
jgi:hypothetical protein